MTRGRNAPHLNTSKDKRKEYGWLEYSTPLPNKRVKQQQLKCFTLSVLSQVVLIVAKFASVIKSIFNKLSCWLYVISIIKNYFEFFCICVKIKV